MLSSRSGGYQLALEAELIDVFRFERLAEQIASRWRWLVCYFGAGIVGELVAYSWQPVGAGNSVAVCGLAGLIAVACWRRDARLPAFGSFALLLWCVVILSTWDWPAAVVGAVCAAAVLRLQAGGWRWRRWFAGWDASRCQRLRAR